MGTSWSVGRLRAELVGTPDDAQVVVLVEVGGVVVVADLAGAGYGPGIDPGDPALTGWFPLVAASPT